MQKIDNSITYSYPLPFFLTLFSVRGGATVLEPVGTLFALAKIPTSGSLMKFTITIGQLG